MRGNKLPCDQDAGSPANDILETKTLLSSTISDARKRAKFMSACVKDHFLATPMKNTEHEKFHIKCILSDTILRYNINSLVAPNGHRLKLKRNARLETSSDPFVSASQKLPDTTWLLSYSWNCFIMAA